MNRRIEERARECARTIKETRRQVEHVLYDDGHAAAREGALLACLEMIAELAGGMPPPLVAVRCAEDECGEIRRPVALNTDPVLEGWRCSKHDPAACTCKHSAMSPHSANGCPNLLCDCTATVQRPVEVCDRVYGCADCGKPVALVGDKLVTGLCMWCIAKDAPRASAKFNGSIRVAKASEERDAWRDAATLMAGGAADALRDFMAIANGNPLGMANVLAALARNGEVGMAARRLLKHATKSGE